MEKNINKTKKLPLSKIHFFCEPTNKADEKNIYRFCVLGENFALFLHNYALYPINNLEPKQNFMIRYFTGDKKALKDAILHGITFENSDLSHNNNLFALTHCVNLKNIHNVNFDYDLFRDIGTQILQKSENNEIFIKNIKEIEKTFVLKQKQFFAKKEQSK